jgi:fructose-1-phosphate kinase PfkB-like protein
MLDEELIGAVARVGMKTETLEEVITAARVLIDNHGIASVLVKRGAQGSVLISGHHPGMIACINRIFGA